MTAHRLPRGVAALLERLLPRDMVDPIAGDLLEEYGREAARRGRMRADLWAWAHAIRIAATFRGERHRRRVPPIAEELTAIVPLWEAFRHDVAFGVRMLRRQPAFAIVALLALAVGIGADTAIFTVADAVLWRPLPFAAERRVLDLAEQRPRESRWFGPVSPADFYDWRRDSRSFDAMAAYNPAAVNLTGAGDPERLRGLAVTSAFFDTLGVAPSSGRIFREDEEILGRHRVALLTDGLWRRRFGADPAVVGRSVTFDGNVYDIVGVLPASFWWPSHPDVLFPLALSNDDRALRGAHFLNVIGRMKGGVSPEQAHEELDVLGRRLSQQYPVENARHFPNTRPLREALVGDVRPALIVLLGAVGFVMLIACANVATLLLARTASRRKELAIRRAMGAPRGRIARQVLTESLVVALGGGLAGLLLAAWAVAGLRAIVPPQFAALPGVEHLSLDARAAWAALALTILTAGLFGAGPALVASAEYTGAALNEEARGSSGSPRARRLRSALIVVELALSFVLLTGAGLLIVSFDRLAKVGPGFRPEQVSAMWLTLSGNGYREYPRVVAFYETLLDRIASTPGVTAAAATTAPPFSGEDARLNLKIENRMDDGAGPVRAHPRLVTSAYFTTMGIPLVRGRLFDARDGAESARVAIVNDAAARRYWPTEDPIGQRISMGARDNWLVIVGIVGDVRYGGLDADTEPEAYMPHTQGFIEMGATWPRTLAVVVRAADGSAIGGALRTAVHEIDPQQPVGVVRSMDEMIAASVAPRRLNSLLVSMFAVVAVALTSAGLFGVMSYVVAQRTREIGVRMALGATPRQVLAMIFREAGTITALGIALGISGALGLTRSMTSLLFGVTPADPRVYAGVSALLVLVALAAVAVPSLRATRIDPLAALREP